MVGQILMIGKLFSSSGKTFTTVMWKIQNMIGSFPMKKNGSNINTVMSMNASIMTTIIMAVMSMAVMITTMTSTTTIMITTMITITTMM